MRVLHCSDIHANVGWMHWIAQTASEYELICLSGDLLNILDDGFIPSQQREIKKILASIKTPLAICSGNHDTIHAECSDGGKLWIADLKRENVWVDGDRFQVGGHKFYCHGWNEPIPEAKPDEIWVIHSPPEKCPAAVNEFGDDYGDHEFAVLCRSGRGPKLAFCGHVHSPQAWAAIAAATRVFNPGCIPTVPWPSHIVFDLGGGTATRHRPGHSPETTYLLGKTPYELLQGMSAERFEELLRLTVLNQQIEGYHMRPEEIEECRRRLRKIARGES